MGVRNVAHVLTNYNELPPHVLVIAVQIALSALDKETKDHPRGHYWGGVPPLARLTKNGLDESGEPTPAAERAVQRVLKTLVDRGVLVRVVTGRRGQRAEYAMTYMTRLLPVDGTTPGDALSTSDSTTPNDALEAEIARHPVVPQHDTGWRDSTTPGGEVARHRVTPPRETQDEYRNTSRTNNHQGEHVTYAADGIATLKILRHDGHEDDTRPLRVALLDLGPGVYEAPLVRAQGEGLSGEALYRRALELARGEAS